MKTFMYVIRDNVAEDCGPIFTAKTDGVAIRNYENYINKDVTVHKEDYDLLRVGSYDSEQPLVKAHLEPIVIVDGADKLHQEKEKPKLKEVKSG